MAKKDNKKNSEAEKLKAGAPEEDSNESENSGEGEGENGAEDSKENSAPPASKTGNVKKAPVRGTFLFNKLKNK